MNMARREKIATLGTNNNVVETDEYIYVLSTDLFGNEHKKYLHENEDEDPKVAFEHMISVFNHNGTMYRLLAKEIPMVWNGEGRVCIRERCKNLRTDIDIIVKCDVLKEHDLVILDLEIVGFTENQTNELLINWDRFISMHTLLSRGEIIHGDFVQFNKNSPRLHVGMKYIMKFEGIM